MKMKNLLKLLIIIFISLNNCCAVRLINIQLIDAAICGDIDKIKSLLLQNADINTMDYYKCSPLHWACRYGNLEACKLLIEKGANVNATDEHNETPLHKAISNWTFKNNDILICKLLLHNRANINSISDKEGSPLHLAVRCDNRKIFNLLIENNADINIANNSGETVLMYASKIPYNEKIFKKLLLYGANINAVNKDNENVLHIAAKHGNTIICKLLLEK